MIKYNPRNRIGGSLLVDTVVKAEQAYLDTYGKLPTLIILSSRDFSLWYGVYILDYIIGVNLITSDTCPSGQCIVGEMIYNIKGD